MNDEEITGQILAAWDEETSESEPESEPEEEVAAGAEEDEPGAEEEPAAEQEGEDESEPDGEEEEPEEEVEGEPSEETPPEVVASDDPEVQAFLAKYQGDPERALKGAIQMQRAVSRQGQEKLQLQRRISELEAEVAQAQLVSPTRQFLNDEQREWVEQAVGSDSPASWVQQAIGAGEFGLARAVCDEWAASDPYNAMRVLQAVEQVEWQAGQAAQPEPEPLDHAQLMDILVEHFPEMPGYEQQMVSTLEKLGANHPLAVDARSQDPEQAARGIIGLYEIARASTASVNGAREQAKKTRKQAAQDVRRSAAVTSAQAAPTPSQSPRPQTVMPGLTLEDLDAEWSR